MWDPRLVVGGVLFFCRWSGFEAWTKSMVLLIGYRRKGIESVIFKLSRRLSCKIRQGLVGFRGAGGASGLRVCWVKRGEVWARSNRFGFGRWWSSSFRS